MNGNKHYFSTSPCLIRWCCAAALLFYSYSSSFHGAHHHLFPGPRLVVAQGPSILNIGALNLGAYLDANHPDGHRILSVEPLYLQSEGKIKLHPVIRGQDAPDASEFVIHGDFLQSDGDGPLIATTNNNDKIEDNDKDKIGGAQVEKNKMFSIYIRVLSSKTDLSSKINENVASSSSSKKSKNKPIFAADGDDHSASTSSSGAATESTSSEEAGGEADHQDEYQVRDFALHPDFRKWKAESGRIVFDFGPKLGRDRAFELTARLDRDSGNLRFDADGNEWMRIPGTEDTIGSPSARRDEL